MFRNDLDNTDVYPGNMKAVQRAKELQDTNTHILKGVLGSNGGTFVTIEHNETENYYQVDTTCNRDSRSKRMDLCFTLDDLLRMAMDPAQDFLTEINGFRITPNK